MTGKLVHFELATMDSARAAEFFEKLFGWQSQAYGDSYHYVGGTPSGGIYGGEPGRTLVYFEVDDIEATVERIRDLGGDGDGIQDLPGIGRSAHCRDGQGTAFSLFQAAPASETP